MSVSCEEIRELLPAYAEWGPRPAGAVEVHIASCARCSAELAAYRQMMSSLAEMRRHEEEPPAGYLERTLALVPGRERVALSELPQRVIDAAKRRPAVTSLTGAAIGVAAIGVIAWRLGRRASRLSEPLSVPSPG